jgi:heme A synthase
MRRNRFAAYAWGVLAYLLLVVAWGAYVRATGSGAGCGRHWPLCDGVVVPRAQTVQMAIEFTHRVTSGISLLAVVGLLVWAVRLYPRGHRVRRGAWGVMILIVTEALLGAGLVLFELVADNASMVRAFSMVAHLTNTFLLIGALTLTAWWASGGAGVRMRQPLTRALLVGLASVLLVGGLGAIAALGDTLFPAASFAEGLREDFSSTVVHPLVALRKYHPLVAIAAAVYLVTLALTVRRRSRSADVALFSRALVALVLVQLVVGAVNVRLAAPVSMQLVHLMLADLVWIALVLFSAAALAVEERLPAAPPRPAPAPRLDEALEAR